MESKNPVLGKTNFGSPTPKLKVVLSDSFSLCSLLSLSSSIRFFLFLSLVNLFLTENNLETSISFDFI